MNIRKTNCSRSDEHWSCHRLSWPLLNRHPCAIRLLFLLFDAVVVFRRPIIDRTTVFSLDSSTIIASNLLSITRLICWCFPIEHIPQDDEDDERIGPFDDWPVGSHAAHWTWTHEHELELDRRDLNDIGHLRTNDSFTSVLRWSCRCHYITDEIFSCSTRIVDLGREAWKQ